MLLSQVHYQGVESEVAQLGLEPWGSSVLLKFQQAQCPCAV